MTYTKEQLIDMAIAKGYELGTVVDSLGGVCGHKIEIHPNTWYLCNKNENLRESPNCLICVVEYDGIRWAKIISQPNPIINSYDLY